MKWEEEKNGSVYGGVNNFGFGGANVHVVLEGLQAKKETVRSVKEKLQICTLSARDPQALRELAESYIAFLKDTITRQVWMIFVTHQQFAGHIIVTICLLWVDQRRRWQIICKSTWMEKI